MEQALQMSKRNTAKSTGSHIALAWTDAADCGVVTATGADRIDLLHRLSTNDMMRLPAGAGRQTVLVTDKGRIIDVITVLNDESSSVIITSANKASTVASWLHRYIITDDARFRDVTSSWVRLDILGTEAAEFVNSAFGFSNRSWALCSWEKTLNEEYTVVRVPSVTDIGFAVLGSPEAMANLRSELQAESHIPYINNEDFEYLRVIRGLGKSESEWTEAYNPLEAGLLHLVSFSKGCYIGQEVIARLDTYNKVKQKLFGLRGATIERGGEVEYESTIIGKVTSVVPSCNETDTIALAYIRTDTAVPGMPVFVKDSNHARTQAVVCSLPITEPCQ